MARTWYLPDGTAVEGPDVEQIQVSVSIIVQKNGDGSWSAWPEHADYYHYKGEDRVDAIREVLKATADLFEEE